MHSRGRNVNLNYFIIDSNVNIGPGYYKPNDNATSPSIKGFNMSKTSRSTKHFNRSSWLDNSPTKDNPGSGSYNMT